MKSSAFAHSLDLAADLLDVANAGGSAKSVRALATLFSSAPTATVKDVIKKLEAVSPESGSFLHAKVETLAALAVPLKALVCSFGSKSVVADFELLLDLLQKHRSASLEQFVAASRAALSKPAPKAKRVKVERPVRQDLVQLYNKRLEEALGDDDGFRHVYSQLESDPEVGSAELTAIAKRFAVAAPRNREQALHKIFSRHQALMNARAASRATAGRIAG